MEAMREQSWQRLDLRTRHSRTWVRAAPWAVLVLFGLGCGGGGSSAAPEEVARGQKRFRQTCTTCHGPDAQGMRKLGKNLHGNQFVRSKSDDELVEFLRVGRPAVHPLNERGVDMPPRGGNPALTDDDLRSIVAYLRSIQ